MKTLLVTGRPGAGKSSFINYIFMAMDEAINGVRSIRNFDYPGQSAFDLVILEESEMIAKSKLMYYRNGKRLVDTSFINAIEYLKNIEKSLPSEPILIDEVGRFEKNNYEFLYLIESLADSNLKTIISLKKEDLEFNQMLIEKSKLDPAIMFVDLDCLTGKEKSLVMDRILAEWNVDVKNDKVSLFSDDEDLVLSENRIELVGDVFELDFYQAYMLRKDKGIVYYCSKDLDRIKRAADLGFVCKYIT